jgi:hypothetical protein
VGGISDVRGQKILTGERRDRRGIEDGARRARPTTGIWFNRGPPSPGYGVTGFGDLRGFQEIAAFQISAFQLGDTPTLHYSTASGSGILLAFVGARQP